MQRADVWMRELRDRAGFAIEAVAKDRIGRQVSREDLDRDGAVETRVARPKHFAHTARPDPADDLVGSESRAFWQAHRARLWPIRLINSHLVRHAG